MPSIEGAQPNADEINLVSETVMRVLTTNGVFEAKFMSTDLLNKLSSAILTELAAYRADEPPKGFSK